MPARLVPVRSEDAFDTAAVHAWLVRQDGLAGLASEAPPSVRQFTGGASNLTYLLSYPDRELVLRQPPHGHKAASAHDMRREVRVQKGLAAQVNFVPHIYGFCEDASVIGSEFYVMERLEGTVVGLDLPDGVTLDETRARVLGNLMCDALADLHSVDVAAAGLTDLGKGDGYVRRQVSGWSRRYRDALTDDVPDGEAVMAWLDAHQPPDVAQRLLHGDWKLDNVVLDLDADPPRIIGVLDWEMATVGDPLMDLGASLAYWITADDDPSFALMRRQPSDLPGMPTREEIVSRYLARTGLVPPAPWEFYEVFGLFRLAVIIQQIWARFRSGATTNPRFADYGSAATILLRRAGEKAGVPV